MNIRLAGLVATLVVGTTSCATDLTELVVSVNITAGIPCDLDSVRVTADDGTGPRVLSQPVAAGQVLPLTATIVGGSTVNITVEGLRGGAPALRATSTVTMQSETTLLLPIVLAPECTVDSPCTVAGDALATFESLPAGTTPGQCIVCTPIAADDATCDNNDDDCDGLFDEDADCPSNVERYEVEDVTGFVAFSQNNACESDGLSGVILRDADEQEELIPADILAELQNGNFNFDYFGRNVNSIWVGENGYIAFGTEAPMSTAPIAPGAVDGPGVPRPGVLAFWDRLQTRNNGVCVTLTNDSRQRLIFTWDQACFAPDCSAGDSLTFSIVLEESDVDGDGMERGNNIFVLYDPMGMQSVNPPAARGSGATAGITRPDRRCTQDECDDDGLCTAGDFAGQPCGDIQIFSREAQDQLQSTEFLPVES